ncbi:hypothetical protein L226DRAFT_535895 [Lentinus tigrinus ALCF2SS1-7]|uniref:REJ domain-containing protein n=1 Tax=Lentinus tigrinus ALCF2SS1-6 TaxID=1328759 RepID=A0A5C2RYN6_9APHY|nr:hypothetical protein L227DRAFT_579097 [Lentinus tigrinus ALCF2SS1-6]RPD74001.1 hypothetical protein L226DRAFT_535895 [Lentinus tigrinus ALCF2SS1-7]
MQCPPARPRPALSLLSLPALSRALLTCSLCPRRLPSRSPLALSPRAPSSRSLLELSSRVLSSRTIFICSLLALLADSARPSALSSHTSPSRHTRISVSPPALFASTRLLSSGLFIDSPRPPLSSCSPCLVCSPTLLACSSALLLHTSALLLCPAHRCLPAILVRSPRVLSSPGRLSFICCIVM